MFPGVGHSMRVNKVFKFDKLCSQKVTQQTVYALNVNLQAILLVTRPVGRQMLK